MMSEPHVFILNIMQVDIQCITSDSVNICVTSCFVQDMIDVVGALECGCAAKSQDDRDKLCQQQGHILQWLRHKLPTHGELCQVCFRLMPG